MRLDVSTYGILACLTGFAVGQDGGGMSGTTSTGSSSNVVISIGPFPTPAVYTPQSVQAQSGNATIRYGKETSIAIKAVFLRRYGDNAAIGVGDVKGNPGSATTSGSTLIKERDEPIAIPPVKFTVTEDSVELPTKPSDIYGNNVDKALYFEFQWENSTSSGRSFSQLLAVANENEANTAYGVLQSTNLGSAPARPEEINKSPTKPTSISTSAAPSVATATATPEVSSTPAAQISPNRLANGAIAGIAVGCAVAGLLIIGFLVWFLFFRRRNAHSRDYAAGSSGTQHVMMHDKEAAVSGVALASSPHSTFADDGGRLRDPVHRRSVAPGSSTAAAATDDAGSYAPYSDRAPSPSLTAGGPAGSGAGSQTDLHATRSATPPFHTRYAHLIEEGMTEDEIRRLEEEERQLDAAIEDAGRGSRATHQS
ncbi:hypothetical protein GGR54DRAFT_81992 [Hypoxylon sp. NC1633]|nr:hypothetical protein GGR54DRAFT_81992 [Hypoxylon sp. NC1633]